MGLAFVKWDSKSKEGKPRAPHIYVWTTRLYDFCLIAAAEQDDDDRATSKRH